MRTMRKIVAAMMVGVMTVLVFSSTAFAASEKSTSDKMVALAKKTIEGIKTDGLYKGNVDDPVIVYYASQPFSQAFTAANWILDSKKRARPDFAGNVQDLTVGVVSDLGGFFAKNYISKTITTMQDATKDIIDGLKNSPDELVGKIGKRVPIVSNLYKMTGPVGKVTIQAVLLPGYLATNAGALAFVLVGGGAALLVIFGLSGILSPLLALKEGPQTIDQFFRDYHEMETALAKA